MSKPVPPLPQRLRAAAQQDRLLVTHPRDVANLLHAAADRVDMLETTLETLKTMCLGEKNLLARSLRRVILAAKENRL